MELIVQHFRMGLNVSLVTQGTQLSQRQRARQLSLRRSRSFTVTDFRRLPIVRDFLLVHNTDLGYILFHAVFRLSHKLLPLTKGAAR